MRPLWPRDEQRARTRSMRALTVCSAALLGLLIVSGCSESGGTADPLREAEARPLTGRVGLRPVELPRAELRPEVGLRADRLRPVGDLGGRAVARAEELQEQVDSRAAAPLETVARRHLVAASTWEGRSPESAVFQEGPAAALRAEARPRAVSREPVVGPQEIRRTSIVMQRCRPRAV